MPYVYLGLAFSGPICVLLTYRPLRQEPLSVPSFIVGFLVGEVPIQTIVWQVGATVVFGLVRRLQGMGRLARSGHRSVQLGGLLGLAVVRMAGDRVVDAALAQVRDDDFPVPTEAVAAGWDSSWKVSRAIPLRGRSVRVTKNIDYWGDGDRRHRLDIYQACGTAPEGPGGPGTPDERRERR